jgi:hypothetical protein
MEKYFIHPYIATQMSSNIVHSDGHTLGAMVSTSPQKTTKISHFGQAIPGVESAYIGSIGTL